MMLQLYALIIQLLGCMIIPKKNYLSFFLIQWAKNAISLFIDHMGVNHDCSQIGRSRKKPDTAEIVLIRSIAAEQSLHKAHVGDRCGIPCNYRVATNGDRYRRLFSVLIICDPIQAPLPL